MSEMDNKMSPSEYRSLKHMKRARLKSNRNRNIKRVIVIIILGLIVFGIGNHFYASYQRDIFMDKNRIMNMNQKLVGDYMRNLRYRNGVIVDMLFDQDIERDFERTRLNYSKVNLHDFYLDYNIYNSNDRSVEEFDNALYVITDLLEKESLNQEEKEGLTKILQANIRILDGYDSIYQDVEYEEHREELSYLYFYKGEMYYMLSNLISVTCADLDYDFYELDRNIEYIDDSIDRSRTEVELSSYANDLYEFLFDKPGELLEEDRDYHEDILGERKLGYISYVLDEQNLDEKIYASENGQVDYTTDGYRRQGRFKDTLDQKEIRALADTYIERLNQPLLTFQGLHSYINSDDNNREFRLYNISYLIKDFNYVDIYARVDIRISEDGKLLNFSLGDGSLLSRDYVKIVPTLSSEEAVEALDSEIQPLVEEVVLEINSRYIYHVIFEKYGERFVADVHGETGELINITAEDMIYKYY